MNTRKQRYVSLFLMVILLMTNISSLSFAGSIERRNIESMSNKSFQEGQYHDGSMYKASELDDNLIKTKDLLNSLGMLLPQHKAKENLKMDDILKKLDGVMPGFGSVTIADDGKGINVALIHNSRFAMVENGKETPIFCLSYGLPSLAEAEKEGKPIVLKPLDELRDIKDPKKLEQIKEVLYLYSEDDVLLDGLNELEKEWVTGLALYMTTGRLYNSNSENPVIYEDSGSYYLRPEIITRQNMFTALSEKGFVKIDGAEEYIEEQKKLVDLAVELMEKAKLGVDKGDAVLRNSIGLSKINEAKIKDDGSIEIIFSINSDDHKMLKEGKASITVGASLINNEEDNISEKDFDLEAIKENENTVDYKLTLNSVNGKDIKGAVSNITIALSKDVVTQQILVEESGKYQDMIVPGVNRLQKAINYKVGTKFEISKVDSQDNDKLLEGAHFDIDFKGTDRETMRLITGKDGKISFFIGNDILEDENFEGITFKEVKAPKGYKVNSTEVFVEKDKLLEYGSVSHVVENSKIAPAIVELNKTDLTTGEPVEGAIIEISSEDVEGFETIRYTSDADGKISFEITKPGKYQFKETVAPEGYVLNEEVFEFEVYEEDGVLKVKGDDTITNKPMDKEVEVVLNKTNLTTGEPVEGAIIEISSKDVEGFETIRYASDAEGKISFTLTEPGKYQFKETIAPKGYALNEEVFEFEVYREDGELKVRGDDTITNKPVANVELNKTDLTTGEPVEGAKIEISSKDVEGFETIEYISDADGKISFEIDTPGKYQFKETVAPEGYVVSEEVFEFEVYREDGKLKVRGDDTITNKPVEKSVDIELSKTDLTTGKPVEGAKIEISSKDVKDFETIEYTSDADGKISFKLTKPGKYQFKETVAPKGYILNEEVFEFEVYEENGELKVKGDNTITNEPIKPVKVELNKTDLTTGEPVEGAKIEISSVDVEDFETIEYISDAEGKISFEITKPGKYQFKETVAPEGYILNEEIFEFEVYEENYELKVRGDNTITNKPVEVEVELNKTDLTTGEPVEGAIIEISSKDVEGFETIRYPSDAEGKISFKLTKPGKYQFRETVAPEGYVLNEEVFEFEVYEEDGVLKVKGDNTITNKPVDKEVEVILNKTDLTTGEPVEGAKIEISSKDVEDFETIEYISDAEGKISFKLTKPGKYQFRETVAPEGYVLNEEVFEFEVYEEDGVLKVKGDNTITNKPVDKEVEVILNKTDLTTGEPVEGAKIEISSKDVEDFETIEYISDAEGKISFKLTKPGKYQFKETVAPEGYVLNEEVFEFEVYEEDGELKVKGDDTITNKPIEKTFEIKFSKRDYDTNENLADYGFLLLNDKKEEVMKLESDKIDALEIKGLKAGKYYLKEVKAPKGYEMIEEELSFTITEDGEVLFEDNPYLTIEDTNHVVVYNNKLGVVLVKKDGNTDERLEGAVFEINKKGEEEVFTVESDENGQMNLTGLLSGPGIYEIREKVAPVGYQRISDVIILEIKDNGDYVLKGENISERSIFNFKIGATERPTPEDPTPEEPTPEEPTPEEPTPEEPTPEPKPEGVVPKPDGEDYEDVVEEEDEWGYEYEYDEEDPEVVVDEEVKTGEARKAFELLRIAMLFLAVGVAVYSNRLRKEA